MIPAAEYLRGKNDPAGARAAFEHTVERLKKLGGSSR
jgi:hypothetical protein